MAEKTTKKTTRVTSTKPASKAVGKTAGKAGKAGVATSKPVAKRATPAKREEIGKQRFLEELSHATGMGLDEVSTVYEAMIDIVVDHAVNNRDVMLTGFGRFYPLNHKGHKVRFGTEGAEIKDYMVLKFSASRTMNKLLDEAKS